ncbi:MAG TPA: Ig-like domain-containing protein [Candidatus Acidoferrales bacterium]|nr:Ig-like domain-containing protein [Candidatus Acidoferrales bacterium]
MKTPFRIGLVSLVLALAGAELVLAEGPAIHMDGGVFRVVGWQAGALPAAGWSALLSVYAGVGDVPPLLGTYSVEAGTLTFRPRFSLSPGMHVRAVFQPPGGPPVEAVFEIAKAAPLAATTRVAHVYPSTDILPANQLKLYIYFSAPMGRGDAWRHIRLLREDGSAVALPFLEIAQELWDRDNLRLTVLFDPGRIKRGLASLAEAGPALEQGKRYTLAISRDWLDGRGAVLADEYRKDFRVGPADRTPPEVATGQVTAPQAGGTDALVLHFPKPMDYALLQHSIAVTGPSGAMEGGVAVASDETEWRFTPHQAWTAGTYRIIVQTTLEDLAGNHIGRAFDVDTFDRVTKVVTQETVDVPFQVQ